MQKPVAGEKKRRDCKTDRGADRRKGTQCTSGNKEKREASTLRTRGVRGREDEHKIKSNDTLKKDVGKP